MKLIALLLMLVACTLSFAQSNDSLTLRGTIQRVSYHQGGIQLHPDVYLPKPYKTRIWIVRYIDSLTPSIPVQLVQTDSLGTFEIQLPEGKYGFVTEGDLPHLQPGQVLPTKFEHIDQRLMESDVWNSFPALPLGLKEDTHITITRYQTSSCYKCP